VDPGVVSIAPLGTADTDPRLATRTGVEQRWRVVAVLPPTTAVDIVIPVHNEGRDSVRSVGRLHAYLQHEFPFSARITIAIHPVPQLVEDRYDQLGQFGGQISGR
jgi:hypothetical protein